MNIRVISASPHDTEATRLLNASHQLMDTLFPAESCHYLGVEELAKDNVKFFIAYRGDAAVGCGALANYGSYGEVKSMYVDETARGHGVADAILKMVEDEARIANLPVLRLETADLLAAAIKLYEKHGFTRCPPFGSYEEDPLSTFMEKPL